MDFESRVKATLGELVFADIRNGVLIAQLQKENADLKKAAAEEPAEVKKESKAA